MNSFPKKLFVYAVCKEIFGYEIHFEHMNFIEKKFVGLILGYKSNYSELWEPKIDSFAKVMKV